MLTTYIADLAAIYIQNRVRREVRCPRRHALDTRVAADAGGAHGRECRSGEVALWRRVARWHPVARRRQSRTCRAVTRRCSRFTSVYTRLLRTPDAGVLDQRGLTTDSREPRPPGGVMFSIHRGRPQPRVTRANETKPRPDRCTATTGTRHAETSVPRLERGPRPDTHSDAAYHGYFSTTSVENHAVVCGTRVGNQPINVN
jgi:hypothetical protein